MHCGKGMALSPAQEHRRVRGGRTGTEDVERGEAQRLHLGKERQEAVQRGSSYLQVQEMYVDFNAMTT